MGRDPVTGGRGCWWEMAMTESKRPSDSVLQELGNRVEDAGARSSVAGNVKYVA